MASFGCCLRKDRPVELVKKEDLIVLSCLQLTSSDHEKLQAVDSKVQQVITHLADAREHTRTLAEENAKLEGDLSALRAEHESLKQELAKKGEGKEGSPEIRTPQARVDGGA
eukprot:CAMPEP_0175240060 /NCGR_PEP_ID=MMETSP0093-20121207/29861_1 /TAXON_ID=311494 /ORGANISM="Alexandrium monilatum, Strain CCMP3105" /LENGTH=111 /DNA_ID=CAMNT_0016534099 /DNA_START=52 /DNA_END=387 /DNA_ORIENTATION=-